MKQIPSFKMSLTKGTVQISHLTGCTIEYLRQIKAALSPESGSVT